MKIFLDTADLGEIEKWLKTGILDGITTNPSLVKKKNPIPIWKKIIEAIRAYSKEPISLSVEVFGDTPGAMLRQADYFIRVLNYSGLAIKIPILGVDGTDRLGVVHKLSDSGITVNCTACVDWHQAFWAAKAGAKYVSLLYRRIIDMGSDGLATIKKTRKELDDCNLKSEIIAGSIREARDVFDVYEAGVHIVTVPPKFMPKIIYQKKSVETQEQFLRDAGML